MFAVKGVRVCVCVIGGERQEEQGKGCVEGFWGIKVGESLDDGGVFVERI